MMKQPEVYSQFFFSEAADTADVTGDFAFSVFLFVVAV